MNVVPITEPTPVPDLIPEFDDFWAIWPIERRLCKKDARIAWGNTDPAIRVHILTQLVAWCRVWRARGEYEYVLHPHRWLRNERYEDELPVAHRVSHASHVPVKPAAATERTEMPAHVRELIQRLRAAQR